LYLKSLEIQGFKSFPEKTRLSFEKPITGIIGPNGSGKSNIADAMLWVMGEQSSRTLRGGKMEDVIFGGTQRRAQIGFAEVSLILDNSQGQFEVDSSEVMLTRRYYRSGESEYYINREMVRLKDISELLMDTGLGREGYSIIGQGKISDILSTKSTDRREIFEEAVGISRFRHRKDESERKLRQTDENLVRIGDKISELELQIEPLREQAEIAKRYLLHRDELRGLEIAVWLLQLGTLRERADKAATDSAAAKIQFEMATLALESGYSGIEEISEKMRQCDIDAEALRENITSAQARRSNIESESSVLKSQLENNIEQIERLDLEVKSQDNRQDGVGDQIRAKEERLNQISEEVKSLNEVMERTLQELEEISGQADSRASKLREMLHTEDEIRNKQSERKSELSALASQAQELFDRENAMKVEIAAALEAMETRTKEHEDCKTSLKEAQEETSSLTNVVSGFTIKAQNREKKLAAAEDKLKRVSSELKNLQSRHDLLAEMEKDFQGYSKAVKIIMQETARGTFKNVHGTVGSLLRTDDSYAIAIETALGGAMQNIIVDTEEEGKNAINYLSRRDGGRATFLPLSTIKPNTFNEKGVEANNGFVGIALDLIRFDSKYSNIYSNLLGRVVIAEDLNSAISIARKHGHRFKIVTLDGQVLSAGGSMTGGSVANKAGVLSRANELEQIKARIESFIEQEKSAQREYNECAREKTAAVYELETAQDELRAAQEKLIRIESDESHLWLIINAAREAIDSQESELEALNSRISRNNEETDAVKQGITKLDDEAKSISAEIEAVSAGQEELAGKREDVQDTISELRTQKASLDAELQALEGAVFELAAIKAEMSDSRERQISAIDELKKRNNEIQGEILVNERASSEVLGEIEKLNRSLTEINDKKMEIEAERVALNRSTQEKNKEILDLERECGRLEQKKLAAEMEEKQILDNLWDNYELTRSNAANFAAEISSQSSAQKKISEIKQQMKELGEPNIGAIDEFERVNTRYTFLTTQYEDVETAKQKLIDIINEITAHMRTIFLREFKIINESFGKTFKELFGGGTASLILEDPDDILNCGIEIKVQPPGKSVKTLSLLSGGEKAFVAIAIYFAILAVRPPPFVFMDEIDAALDDANVSRFSEYMRRMSHNTQMVVITHKRTTMEEADMLYGVTMQELGVSNILRIDLDEAEKHMKRSR